MRTELLQVEGGLGGHDGPDRPVGEVEDLGQFALLDMGAAFAQRLDVFPEIPLGVLLGLFPDGGFDGRQAGRRRSGRQGSERVVAPSSDREAASQAASSTLRVKMPG